MSYTQITEKERYVISTHPTGNSGNPARIRPNRLLVLPLPGALRRSARIRSSSSAPVSIGFVGARHASP